MNELRRYKPRKGGPPIDPKLCRASVSRREAGWFRGFDQCTRKAVVDGLWCKQHDLEAIEARKVAADKRWQAKMDNTPLAMAGRRLDVARAEIKRLQALLDEGGRRE